MQGDSHSSPGKDFWQKAVGNVLIVIVPLADLDGQGTGQHTGHALHYLLQLALRLLQQR